MRHWQRELATGRKNAARGIRMEKTEKTTAEYEKKLKAYYDENGRLTQYPSKRPMRILALTKIADQFEPQKKYTDKEVNEIIRTNIAFGDIELIRREMFQYGLIDRLRDGSAYWRKEPREDAKPSGAGD